MVSLYKFSLTCTVLFCSPLLGYLSRQVSLDSVCELLFFCSVLVLRTAADLYVSYMLIHKLYDMIYTCYYSILVVI